MKKRKKSKNYGQMNRNDATIHQKKNPTDKTGIIFFSINKHFTIFLKKNHHHHNSNGTKNLR